MSEFRRNIMMSQAEQAHKTITFTENDITLSNFFNLAYVNGNGIKRGCLYLFGVIAMNNYQYGGNWSSDASQKQHIFQDTNLTKIDDVHFTLSCRSDSNASFKYSIHVGNQTPFIGDAQSAWETSFWLSPGSETIFDSHTCDYMYQGRYHPDRTNIFIYFTDKNSNYTAVSFQDFISHFHFNMTFYY